MHGEIAWRQKYCWHRRWCFRIKYLLLHNFVYHAVGQASWFFLLIHRLHTVKVWGKYPWGEALLFHSHCVADWESIVRQQKIAEIRWILLQSRFLFQCSHFLQRNLFLHCLSRHVFVSWSYLLSIPSESSLTKNNCLDWLKHPLSGYTSSGRTENWKI